MAGGAVHTVHRDGWWVNEVEGEARPIDDAFASKDDAVLAGRDIARDLGVAHRVHQLDERPRASRPTGGGNRRTGPPGVEG